MNILFFSLLDFNSLQERWIYTDLLRQFKKNGHIIYIISPTERRNKQKTHIIKEDNVEILKLKIGNTKKVNVIEKGISTLIIEPQLIEAIKKYFSDIKFNLVLYSTPPITFCNAIEFIKKRDGCKSYLLLKDIFPQNAVDIGLMKTTGIKSIIYYYFRNKERKLYKLSDYIGCMSKANVEYILKNNSEIKNNIVEVCPNSIEIINKSIDKQRKEAIRLKYNIPTECIVFIYGGNLGKPQGIDFLIKCLESEKNNDKIFFLIIGSGTEYQKIEKYINKNKPQNAKLFPHILKEDYDTMVAACDVGLIFLDHRFTIPNFPSRLLSYLQANIPVLACTDPNTDIGKVTVEGNFGWWCESNNLKQFKKCIDEIGISDLREKGLNGFDYLKEHYDVKQAYDIIMKHFNNQ